MDTLEKFRKRQMVKKQKVAALLERIRELENMKKQIELEMKESRRRFGQR